MPTMSRMHAAGDVRAMMTMNSRANVMVGTVLYPLLALAFVFAEEIVTLVYTAAYLEAAAVMRVYIAGMLAMVVEVGSIVLLLRQGPFALRITALALAVSVRAQLVRRRTTSASPARRRAAWSPSTSTARCSCGASRATPASRCAICRTGARSCAPR